MQILAFSHPVGSRQAILENSTDHFTLGTVILIWRSLVWLAYNRSVIIKKMAPKSIQLIKLKLKTCTHRYPCDVSSTLVWRYSGCPVVHCQVQIMSFCPLWLLSSEDLEAVNAFVLSPKLHSKELTLGILNPGTSAESLGPSYPLSLIFVPQHLALSTGAEHREFKDQK